MGLRFCKTSLREFAVLKRLRAQNPERAGPMTAKMSTARTRWRMLTVHTEVRTPHKATTFPECGTKVIRVDEVIRVDRNSEARGR